jgi:hypothetical protein
MPAPGCNSARAPTHPNWSTTMALCPFCGNETRVADTSSSREFDLGSRSSKALRVAYDGLIKHIPRLMVQRKHGAEQGTALWNSVTLRRRVCRKKLCGGEHVTLELPLELIDMLSSEAKAKDIADAERWREVRSAMLALKGALDKIAETYAR